MPIITVSGKQIDLQAREIKFLDVESGLTRLVMPMSITINIEQRTVSYQIKTKLVTSTGFEIGQEGIENYQLDVPILSVLSDGFNKPFINNLFQDALQKYGIKAKQIFDSTGKLSIIE
jgi:hypothetical protein